MQAAIYNGRKSVSVQELEDPVCGEHDVIIKNLYASIYGTDVAVYQHGPDTGHRITVGGEFGHEVVSRVVAVGSAVKDISLGDIVYPYPRLAKGDPRRAGTIGGFSELIRIPNCELSRQVYRVSDRIPTKTTALIEPFTVGTRAARRARPQQGENAVVFGAGTIGIAAAIALKQVLDAVASCWPICLIFAFLKRPRLGLASVILAQKTSVKKCCVSLEKHRGRRTPPLTWIFLSMRREQPACWTHL